MPARDELLRLYMSEAAATPLLTAEEEVFLARAVGAGARAAERLASEALDGELRESQEADVAAGEAARKRLIEGKLRLGGSGARRDLGWPCLASEPLLDGARRLTEPPQQLDQVHRQADRAGLVSHGAADRLTDPPIRVGTEAEAAVRVVLVDRAEQPQVAFLD